MTTNFSKFFLSFVLAFAVLLSISGFTSSKRTDQKDYPLEQSIVAIVNDAKEVNFVPGATVQTHLSYNALKAFGMLPTEQGKTILTAYPYDIIKNDGKYDNRKYQLIKWHSMNYHLKL